MSKTILEQGFAHVVASSMQLGFSFSGHDIAARCILAPTAFCVQCEWYGIAKPPASTSRAYSDFEIKSQAFAIGFGLLTVERIFQVAEHCGKHPGSHLSGCKSSPHGTENR